MAGHLIRAFFAGLLLVCSLSAIPADASRGTAARIVPLVLAPDISYRALFEHAEFLDDPGRRYTIDDVARGPQQHAFGPFPRARFDDREVAGWFRFALKASSGSGPWALSAFATDEIADLYLLGANDAYHVIHFGMDVPIVARDHRVPSPLLPLTPDMTNGNALFLYIDSHKIFPLQFSRSIRAPLFGVGRTDDIVDGDREQRFIDTFFGGLFFAIIASNLFLGIYLRDRTFLVYVGAMLLHVATQFTQDGSSWLVFWPHLSVPFALLAIGTEAFFLASLALFWRTFLDLPRRAPLLNWFVMITAGAFLLRGVLLLTLPRIRWLTLTDFPMAFALIIAVLAGSVAAVRSGYRPARFLILALCGLLFFWSFTYASYFIDFQTPELISFLMNYGLYFGTAWDALFLTFALADRIETSKRSMLEALQTSDRAKEDVLAAQTETVVRLQERDRAMSRFLPHEFLERLGREGVVDLQLGDHVEAEMTILFSDIRSFTTLSEAMTPAATFALLNAYLHRVGPLIREHQGFIDKYIGDAIMGLFPNEAHTSIDAAIAMQRSLYLHNQERAQAGQAPIAIGVGLHRGPVMLGTIGEAERIETTVIADAVNIASRTESLTKIYRASIIATESVVNALYEKHSYRMRSLGTTYVKGSSHQLRIFEIFDGDPPESILAKLATLPAFNAATDEMERENWAGARELFATIVAASPSDATAAYLEERCRAEIDRPAIVGPARAISTFAT